MLRSRLDQAQGSLGNLLASTSNSAARSAFVDYKDLVDEQCEADDE